MKVTGIVLVGLVFLVLFGCTGSSFQKEDTQGKGENIGNEEGTGQEGVGPEETPKTETSLVYLTATKNSTIMLTRDYSASSPNEWGEMQNWASTISINITGKVTQVKENEETIAARYELTNATVEWKIDKTYSLRTAYCLNNRHTIATGSRITGEKDKITIDLFNNGTYKFKGSVVIPTNVTRTSTILGPEGTTEGVYSCGWTGLVADGPVGTSKSDNSADDIKYSMPITGSYTVGATTLSNSTKYFNQINETVINGVAISWTMIEYDLYEAQGPEDKASWTVNSNVYLPPE